MGGGYKQLTLGECGCFYSGLNGKSKADFENGGARYITYMNVYSHIATQLEIDDRVRVLPDERQNFIQKGDVLFTGSSETPEECGMSSVVTSDLSERIYLNSFCFGFRFNDKSFYLPDFAKFLFRSTVLRRQIVKTASGVTRYNVIIRLKWSINKIGPKTIRRPTYEHTCNTYEN